jgi:hypothetical protein
MFEPIDPRPLDPPEAFDIPDGKEEWIAEKAMEVRNDVKLMYDALDWENGETGFGFDDVVTYLSAWMVDHQTFDDEKKLLRSNQLREVLQEVCERYAEYVLLPAHLEKMKNGDYLG